MPSSGAPWKRPAWWKTTARGTNRGKTMPRRRSKLEKFQANLAALQEFVPEDLRLPSLAVKRMEGFSYLFVLIIPLLSDEGRPIFTDPTLQALFRALNHRFGGCLVA